MANGKIAEAYVEVRADTSKFSADLSQQIKKDLDQAERTATSFGGRISEAFGGGAKAAESFRRALLPAVGALSALGLGAFKAANAASDLAEEQSKATQIFGQGADELNRFAETASRTIGQSQRQALAAASTFGIFGKSAGLAGQDLVDFSKRFTVLASDLASFNNTSPEEAIIAIGAALRGESEPIRRYGVLLDDATLRQTAFTMGIIDSVKQALTPQQKALAASEEIFRQTAVAQGDFARTADGLANSQRTLSAQFQDAQVALGQAFLPLVLSGVTALTSLLRVLADNTGAVVAFGAALGSIATIVIGVNAALRIYNAIATLTKGINALLGASFTRLQVSMGVIGGVLAVATVAYGLFTSSKDDARLATDRLTEALKQEGDAQREALLATLEAQPELRDFATFMRNEFGVTLEELGNSLGANAENADSYANAIYDSYQAGRVTFAEMTKHLGILESLRDDLLNAADAQRVLNEQMGAGKIPAIDLEKWYARQNVTIKTGTTDTGKFGSSVDKAAQAMERMRQKVQQARTAIQATFDRALAVANDRLTVARETFAAFADEIGASVRSAFSFGQAQQDASANADALQQALIAQADAQEAYNEAITQTDMAAVIRAQNDLAKATQAVMDAQQRPMTFFDQLNQQATKATQFGELVQQLISRGLQEPALQQVLAAGVDAGTLIAQELLSGADNTLINEANRLQKSVEDVARITGELAAKRFRSEGVAMGEALVAGINDAISKAQIQLTSKGLTPKQIKKLEREFAIKIGFDLSTGTLGMPALANGAIVRSPQTALIGEQGAEAVIPITRPGRALQLMEQSGLASLARSTGAAVNIEQATFVQPVDADLLAAKVNASQLARSLG